MPPLWNNIKKIKGHLRSRSRSSSRSDAKQSSTTQSAGHASTSVTQPTNRSSRLWDETLKKLPPEDQKALCTFPTPTSSKLELLQSMLQIVEEKQKEWDSRRWKVTVGAHQIVFAEQATKIIGWLNKFKDVGDIAINYDPVHAALPWAGVRFLLDAASAESQVVDIILPGVERMMNIIGRCSIYEELYLEEDLLQPLDNTQKQLQRTLTGLYTSILSFLSKACRFFRRNTVARIGDAILNRSDLENFLTEIESWEQQVHRNVDNCYQKTSGLMIKEGLQKVQQLEGLLRSWDEPLIRRIADIHNGLQESKRREILTWVSSVEYERLHYNARDSRIDKSGQWLLAHKDYRAWSGSGESTILWLHGVPGAGKTTLVSTVVDHHLQDENRTRSESALAYFYCDRNRPDTRSAESVMNSIVRQLATPVPAGGILNPVFNLYQEKQKKAFASGPPTFEESFKILLTLLASYKRVVIIVDALDECDRTREKLMVTFCQMVGQSFINVKIFIASRRDDDISKQLQSTPNISIAATDNWEDITSFVTQNIQSLPISPELCGEICRSLIEKSEGVFQWVVLQVAQVKELSPIRGDIRNHLENLPGDLKGTYDQIYDQIRRWPKFKKVIADRAFQWISCAHRALSPAQLVAAVCQDPDSDTIDPIQFDIDFVVAACRNLLVIDESSRICRPSHLSVLEYFEKSHWTPGQMHAQAAKVCLKILNDSSHWNQNFEDLPLDRKDIIRYAVENWQEHLQRCDEKDADARLVTLLKQFLGSMNESSPAYRSSFKKLSGFSYAPSNFKPYSRSCYVIVCFGVDRFIPDWWKLGFDDINEKNAEGSTLLALAATNNQLSTAKGLIEKGADINLQGGRHGSPLGGAACRDKKIVELLLDRGADINLKGGYFGSPLGVAAAYEKKEILELLLDRGADINLQGGDHGSPLGEAAAHEHKEIVELLLDRGADINLQGGHHGSPLGGAAAYGHKEIVELLLDRGADINLQGGHHGSPLGGAAAYGYKEIVELLLDRGADINLQGGDHGSPLGGAAWTGNKQIVELLLDRGANVNIGGGKYGSPLGAARKGLANGKLGSRARYKKIIALLLERGARPLEDENQAAQGSEDDTSWFEGDDDDTSEFEGDEDDR